MLLQLIKGEVKLVDACREHDLKQSEVRGLDGDAATATTPPA